MARIRLLAGDLSAVAGSSRYSEELALRLAARGHQVSVVCFRATPRIRDLGSVLETDQSTWREGKLIWRMALYLDKWHCYRALDRAWLPSADVVIGLEHMFLRSHKQIYPALPLIYVPLSLVAPEEIRSYNLNRLSEWLSMRLFHNIQSWALRNAAVTVRFNRFSCDALDAYYSNEEKIRYAINPIAVPIPNSEARPGQQKNVRLLSVGRLVRSKNVELAIAGLSKLRDYPWEFDIIGKGEHMHVLQALIASEGLEGRVRCHGHQPDITDFFQRADLFLFTSRLDNAPLAVLEAMSYGVPVLAIRPDGRLYRSGVAEMIDNGRTGLLASDEADFVRQLQAVLSEPETLAPLGRAARTQIMEQHSWDQHIRRYEQLVESLVEMRSKTQAPMYCQA